MNQDAEKRTQIQRIQTESPNDVDPNSGQGVGQGSEATEDKQIGADREDGERIVFANYIAILGKILSQLKKLQDSHLAYVNAHGERLEARLTENRAHKEQVIEEMRELEGEILNVMEEVREKILLDSTDEVATEIPAEGENQPVREEE